MRSARFDKLEIISCLGCISLPLRPRSQRWLCGGQVGSAILPTWCLVAVGVLAQERVSLGSRNICVLCFDAKFAVKMCALIHGRQHDAFEVL